MEAILYAATTGVLVLVPNCFKPPRELEQAHGRFRVCGRISVENVETPLWRRILSDFDGGGFALLGPRDADRLFGAEALWGFSDRRGAPREMKLSIAQVRQRMIRWTPVVASETVPAIPLEDRRSTRQRRGVGDPAGPQEVRKGVDAVGDAVAGVGDGHGHRVLSPTTG
jgi:hypothetical protein